MNVVRSLFAFLLLVCAFPAIAASPSGSAGRLVLEDFFRGRLVAEGTFRSTIDGSVRGMKVEMRGRWDKRSQTLELVEDFVFSDGEKDRKTWRFTKIAEGRYVGAREDVVGTAEVVQDGDAVRLTYRAVVKTKGGSSFTVSFDDLLILTGPRTVRNTATVRWLFFTVGEVDLAIRRTGGR
jgi:hypothetical protein